MSLVRVKYIEPLDVCVELNTLVFSSDPKDGGCNMARGTDKPIYVCLKATTWTGDRIEKFMQKHDFSQKQLSSMTGGKIRQTVISKWIRENSTLSYAYCVIFDILEATIDRE